MTANPPSGVINTMAAACVSAYCTGSHPFIYLQTHELELVLQVALAADRTGNFVLLKEENRESSGLAPYYQYLNPDIKDLNNCVNFSDDEEKINAFPLDENGNSYTQPHLFVMYLQEQTNPRSKAAEKNIEILCSYLKRYVKSSPGSVMRRSCVLLYGHLDTVSDNIKKITRVVEEPYPKRPEIEHMLRTELARLSDTLHPDDIRRFTESENLQHTVVSMVGLQYLQVKRLISTLLLPCDHPGEAGDNTRIRLFNSEQRLKTIREEKETVMPLDSSTLTLIPPDASVTAPVGMERLIAWVRSNLQPLTNPRTVLAERGVTPLKGILLCGVPGCGKSHAAAWLGSKLNLYTVKISMDKMMGSYLGQSEENLRTALSIATAMAPCICWIDELDKSIPGQRASGTRDGTSSRMLSILLQWMQENNSGCFVLGTANDIGNMPPESLRKERFDMLWSIFLPTQEQCKELFRVHMELAEKRRAQERAANGLPDISGIFSREENNNCFSDEVLQQILLLFAKRKMFFTGADIAAIVNSAIRMLPKEKFRENGLSKKIQAGDWLDVMEKIAREWITDVTRQKSLVTVAANYIRLLRDSFLPASDHLLFDPDKYKLTSGDGKNNAIQLSPLGSEPHAPYDRELYKALNPLLQLYAPLYEKNLSQKEFS